MAQGRSLQNCCSGVRLSPPPPILEWSTAMLFLKVMEDMNSVSKYTNKVIASYLMLVKSTIFVKLGRIYSDRLHED